jgi:hypothetical protein
MLYPAYRAMKNQYGSIWHQSGTFWVGAGLVVEALFSLVPALAPSGACEATLGHFISCPPPLWFIIVLAIVAFFATAYLAHRLGLGD